MEFKEIKGDLFGIKGQIHLAHCISSDARLGAGIAVLFEKHFGLRESLLRLPLSERRHPTCIRIGEVFNLITKEFYYHKPTYETVQEALILMRDQMVEQGIHQVAMPRIASGLDRLAWEQVKRIIVEVFKNTDIKILVYYQ